MVMSISGILEPIITTRALPVMFLVKFYRGEI
jgi:hypothetical protein